MLKKILFTLGIAIVMGNYASAQNATIKGKVTEDDGKTPIEFATVQLMQGGQMVMGASADDKGNYTLSPVASGKYDLIVSSMGYKKYTLEGLEIRGNVVKIQDVVLFSTAHVLGGDVTVIATRPMIEEGQITTETRITAQELNEMAGKGISDILATIGGVTTGAGGTSFRGNRPGEQGYMVDGVKTNMLPPRSAWAEFALIQGAVPAEYAESAMIEIETKGYSSAHSGSIEARGIVNGYNSNVLEFYFTGPLAKRKKDNTIFMGYMINGRAAYSAGGQIRGGYYRASEETIDYLIDNPHRAGSNFSTSVYAYNADFVTKYQEGDTLSLAEKKGRLLQNVWSMAGNVNGRLDFKIGKNVDLMVRGGVDYSKGKSGNYFSNMLFNSINNGISEDFRWDLNARLTHRIKTDPKSKIKNVFYRLYGYYYHGTSKDYNHAHKDSLFNYGYLGTFDVEWGNSYSLETVQWEGQDRAVMVMQDPYWRSITFTAADMNPEMERYTSLAITRMGGLDPLKMVRYGELYNGELPSNSAYGFFNAPGTPYNNYSKTAGDRAAAKAALSFDLGNHSIKFGFDFEQSISRSHSVSPVGLWEIMRNVTNRHITGLNRDSLLPVYDEFGRFLDTINYPRLNAGGQSRFDEMLRAKLGLDTILHWDSMINVDAYRPDMYSLDMFSAQDLFNKGTGGVLSFRGYDYTGTEKINRPITMPDMEKWFGGGKEEDLIFDRIGAYKPVKISAYIQDKFAIRSLYFDLGLRLDIYNKNQPYVEDMFLYRKSLTVEDAVNTNRLPEDILQNMPEINNNRGDFYVYVVNPDDPIARPTAYRRGMEWFSSDGVLLDDIEQWVKDMGTTELLPLWEPGKGPKDDDATKVSASAFNDYKPGFKNGGVALSPRIAFAFTVGEKSKFTASYNVITKDENQALNPIVYLYFDPYARRSGNSGSQLPNPGLKPSRDINYEIGFEQGIGKNMKVNIIAYYSEKRDQLQVYHFSQAYPTSYYSYTNMDFGTTQGFIFGLEMRRVKNLSFRTNYTLQFAKGTGSSATSSLTLIRSGAPNLRTLTVLSFDQRHKLSLSLTYAYGAGNAYNGPISKKEVKNTGKVREIKWLQLAGANLTFSGNSGAPYTASSVPYSTLVSQGERLVQGSINGSRMPWGFGCDLNIWKGFPLVLKDSDDPRARKLGSLQISLAIMNLLQLDEIQSVYSYTGSPTDDGFLTATKYQQYIANQTSPTSFIDYYTIRMEGLNRTGGPRLLNLSVRFEF